MSYLKFIVNLIRFKWYHLYFFLAAFDILTISLALLLNHTVLEIYSNSVENNSVWSKRVSHFTKLNELAADVNAPGNDAFDGGDLPAKQRRLNEAYRTFEEAIAFARVDLQECTLQREKSEFLQILDQIDNDVSQIFKEATAVFDELSKNNREAAGFRMAEMDRCLSRSLTKISRLCENVRKLQASRFETETLRAQKLGQYEFVLAVTVCLILCLVTWYGHKLSKKMQHSEMQNRFSEKQIKAVLESAPDPIITFSINGIIESFNPAAEHLFGYTQAEVIGKNISMLMPRPYRDEHDDYISKFLNRGESHIIGIGREVQGLRKDRTIVPLWLSVSLVESESEGSNSSPRLFTGLLRDLTIHKLREEELLEANRKAEEFSAFGQILDQSLNEIYIQRNYFSVRPCESRSKRKHRLHDIRASRNDSIGY